MHVCMVVCAHVCVCRWGDGHVHTGRFVPMPQCARLPSASMRKPTAAHLPFAHALSLHLLEHAAPGGCIMAGAKCVKTYARLRAGRCQVDAGEGAVLEVQEWGGLVLYATQRGALHGYDLRMGGDAWVLPCKPLEVGMAVRAHVCVWGCASCVCANVQLLLKPHQQSRPPAVAACVWVSVHCMHEWRLTGNNPPLRAGLHPLLWPAMLTSAAQSEPQQGSFRESGSYIKLPQSLQQHRKRFNCCRACWPPLRWTPGAATGW